MEIPVDVLETKFEAHVRLVDERYENSRRDIATALAAVEKAKETKGGLVAQY